MIEERNNSKKYVLVDGYISMDNKQLFLQINNAKNDLKRKGGWLGILLILITLSLFHDLKNIHYFKSFFYYFDFGLRILGAITIPIILYYLFFLKKSKKKLIINDIIKVEIDKEEFETNLSLVFSNKRELDISFRNLENQLEPFLKDIKKRNSRITIEE